MQKSLLTLSTLTVLGLLAACDNDSERGLVGAGAGAAVSAATGGDPLAGAVLGGAAGVFCDDLGICQ